MIFEICAAVATPAFVALVIYLILTLKSLQRTLNKLETKVDPLSLETFKILQKTNDVTNSVQEVFDAFNPFLHAVNNVGNTLEQVTKEQVIKHQSDEKKRHPEKWEDIIALAAMGIMLWQQIKKRR